MTACAILVIVVMTSRMLVVMTTIVLIRVTMVIVHLSGTPPGLSLSARFGTVSGVRGHSAHNYSTI
jgi:hypothetical protein